ncbi:hypothetical protein RJT34_10813 [Clitoria ternatea]|uniref:Uncharacterized protein n=1 Tax=Clitoria ternatea TaxID=43366 RepID=A0AAN9JIV6_CLITE
MSRNKIQQTQKRKRGGNSECRKCDAPLHSHDMRPYLLINSLFIPQPSILLSVLTNYFGTPHGEAFICFGNCDSFPFCFTHLFTSLMQTA